MTFYAAEHLGGTKYRIEAREDMLIGIYDGYYNSRLHEFSLYRRSVSDNVSSDRLPQKLKVSAYDVKAVWAETSKKASAEDEVKKSAEVRRGDTTCEVEQLKIIGI
ncbi:MAG: hypothetical protein K2K09_07965 [Lachnospiraceae bacterium]|nr:hypothetical protein [Lachnospiraceae bacterium]